MYFEVNFKGSVLYGFDVFLQNKLPAFTFQIRTPLALWALSYTEHNKT
jgi:hypothetical protein